jgi:hypothetical protein
MKIADILDKLQAQLNFGRTLKGRPITEFGENGIAATMQDEKNHGADAIICKNCGIILSSLIVPEGCLNCGSKDLNHDLESANVL